MRNIGVRIAILAIVSTLVFPSYAQWCDPAVDPTCCDPTVDPNCDEVEAEARRNGCLPGTGAGWAACRYECDARYEDANESCDWVFRQAACRAEAYRQFQICYYACDVDCQTRG